MAARDLVRFRGERRGHRNTPTLTTLEYAGVACRGTLRERIRRLRSRADECERYGRCWRMLGSKRTRELIALRRSCFRKLQVSLSSGTERALREKILYRCCDIGRVNLLGDASGLPATRERVGELDHQIARKWGSGGLDAPRGNLDTPVILPSYFISGRARRNVSRRTLRPR